MGKDLEDKIPSCRVTNKDDVFQFYPFVDNVTYSSNALTELHGKVCHWDECYIAVNDVEMAMGLLRTIV